MYYFFSIFNKLSFIVYFKYVHWDRLFSLSQLKLWLNSCFYLGSLLSFLGLHKINPFLGWSTACTYMVTAHISYIFSINLIHSIFLPVLYRTWLRFFFSATVFLEAFMFRKLQKCTEWKWLFININIWTLVHNSASYQYHQMKSDGEE